MSTRKRNVALTEEILYNQELDTNAFIMAGSKKKKIGDSNKIVTSSGQKLDLKKSQKIKELRQKKEQKLTKSKRRELQKLDERKKEKKTRAELIASLQDFQMNTALSEKITTTIAKNSDNLIQKKKPYRSRIRANNVNLGDERKSETVTVHYDTGSSDSENEVNAGAEDSNVGETVPTVEMKEDMMSMVTRGAQEKARALKDKKERLNREEAFFKLLVNIKGQKVIVNRDPKIEKQRTQLPIYAEEQMIVEQINENTVTIISGETGSGKTTQIPQFLYESGYTSNGHMIGITEPRRVAAMSMSDRVGKELNDSSLSSFQIRFEGNRTDKTKILFMTDGVLLKELQTDVQLKKYSVIIIDEAHERSMYSDVLIGLLSRIAVQRVKSGVPLKLIIMSATLRISDFMQSRLFPTSLPQLVNVESRQFPVTVHFEKKTPEDYISAAYQKVCKINERLPVGGILVFVSGQKEVHRMVKLLSQAYQINGKALNLKDDSEQDNSSIDEALESSFSFDEEWDSSYEDEDEEDVFTLRAPKLDYSKSSPLYCLPLYSMMPSHLQRKVFDPPPEGHRLCVVATNVAETSLTIPNIRYVVDTGKEKRRDYDPITGVSQFNVSWISQASANQRLGRAGRVSAGHAYRLYSSAVFEDFSKFPPPEILHKPIDQVILHLKAMNIQNIGKFPFPTLPEKDQVEMAEERLRSIGALDAKSQEVSSITTLGKTILIFPLAPHFGKMLILSNQHSVMPFMVTLISALTVREPLINIASMEGSDNVETQELMMILLKKRRQWNKLGQTKRFGDLNVLLRALGTADFENLDRGGCVKVGLRYEAVKEIRKMRRQLTMLVNKSLKLKEPLVLDPKEKPPNETQIKIMRQIFVLGQQTQVARKVNGRGIPKGAYQAQKLKDFVFIDPTSTLFNEEPEFVLYQEIVKLDGQMKMQFVIEVEPDWLKTIAKDVRFPELNQKTD